MPVAMSMYWSGITAEQYEAIRQLVDFEREAPAGALFHVAAFDDTGGHINDVWETAEDFQRFVDNRLMPAIAQLGIEGEPQVTIRPAYNVYAPGYSAIDLTDKVAATT